MAKTKKEVAVEAVADAIVDNALENATVETSMGETPKAKIVEPAEYLEPEMLQAFGEAVKNTGQKQVAVCGFNNLGEHLERLGYAVVEPKDAKVICTNSSDDAHKVSGYGYLLLNVKPVVPDGFVYMSLTNGRVHTIRKVV